MTKNINAIKTLAYAYYRKMWEKTVPTKEEKEKFASTYFSALNNANSNEKVDIDEHWKNALCKEHLFKDKETFLKEEYLDENWILDFIDDYSATDENAKIYLSWYKASLR